MKRTRDSFEKAKEYTAYAESISKLLEKNSITSTFDAGWAFASALSALDDRWFGTFISTISGVLLDWRGVSGNSILGGILTSSIFGPIGIALGLLVAAGLGIVKLFGGGWEKSVAKKIVAAFDENDFNGKFREGINKYWDQTETAFDKAAAKLDEEWNTYVTNLRETINSYDINDIQHRIAILRNLSDFFENIPL